MDKIILTEKSKKKRGFRVSPLRLFFCACIVLFIWGMGHHLYFFAGGLEDKLEKVDMAVVLAEKGAGIGVESPHLRGKLEKAASLYDAGYFQHILVSGAFSNTDFDLDLEADLKAYLVDRGIPEERILFDSQGKNTFLTAQNTQHIMKENDFDSILIITQYYHISRVKLAFSKFGIQDVYWAHAEYYDLSDSFSMLTEFVAYYAYLFKQGI